MERFEGPLSKLKRRRVRHDVQADLLRVKLRVERNRIYNRSRVCDCAVRRSTRTESVVGNQRRQLIDKWINETD
jgi:hypothetical protein